MQRLIEEHPLRRGSHLSRADGMCAMEMVSWLAGEPHSDEPSCACPVAAAFVRACNDAMTDGARNRYLRPLVPRLVNSRGTAAIERVRGMQVIDCLLHTLLPAWMRARGRGDDARLLAALPPMQGQADLRAALGTVDDLGGVHQAARWVLLRALEAVPPARYVAGVVQVARSLEAAVAWTAAAELVEQMLRPCGPRVEQLAAV